MCRRAGSIKWCGCATLVRPGGARQQGAVSPPRQGRARGARAPSASARMLRCAGGRSLRGAHTRCWCGAAGAPVAGAAHEGGGSVVKPWVPSKPDWASTRRGLAYWAPPACHSQRPHKSVQAAGQMGGRAHSRAPRGARRAARWRRHASRHGQRGSGHCGRTALARCECSACARRKARLGEVGGSGVVPRPGLARMRPGGRGRRAVHPGGRAPQGVVRRMMRGWGGEGGWSQRRVHAA